MKVHCIADQDTVQGFRLAGVEGEIVASTAEAAAALDQVLNRPDVAVVILTDVVAAQLRGHVDAIRLNREHPILVEIPAPAGKSGRLDFTRLIQAAVGIRVEPE
jgi:V/A-type H+-transporting ATPase subunit F